VKSFVKPCDHYALLPLIRPGCRVRGKGGKGKKGRGRALEKELQRLGAVRPRLPSLIPIPTGWPRPNLLGGRGKEKKEGSNRGRKNSTQRALLTQPIILFYPFQPSGGWKRRGEGKKKKRISHRGREEERERGFHRG